MSSVEIKSVDVAEVRRRTDEYARELLQSRPEVEEVIVFGSFANGTYAPGSDLDLFIILREASDAPRDRITRFLPRGSFPVPVDVFPFTLAEMEERSGSPLLLAMSQSQWRYCR